MPSESPSRHLRTEPVFIGFAGRIGAGKTSAAKHVSSRYGFQRVRYSQVLQRWRCPGVADRDRLRDAGWEVMAGGLQLELNERLLALLDRSRSAAIDGIRHAIDIDSLSAAFGPAFCMIFIEASAEVRFERLRSRFRAYREFKDAESHAVESHVEGLKPLAAFAVSNDESLGCFHRRLEEALMAWGLGDHH